LGVLVEAASLLKERMPSVEFILVTLETFEDLVTNEAGKAGLPMAITTEHKYEALKHSDLAITCSGTATLEAALLGTPMIVIYKLALFSWAVGRLIVKVPYISLVNLVAGRKIVPEFVQDQVSAGALADEAARMLGDRTQLERISCELEEVRGKLASGGATTKAARVALSLLDK
jgi:lipid-A-disaccharide synthase